MTSAAEHSIGDTHAGPPLPADFIAAAGMTSVAEHNIGDTHAGPPLPADFMSYDVVGAAGRYSDRVAVVQGAQQHTYGAVLGAAHRLAEQLRSEPGGRDLKGRRVALMAPPGVGSL